MNLHNILFIVLTCLVRISTSFQVEVTFAFSKKTMMRDVDLETKVSTLRTKTIDFMKSSQDTELNKAAERPDRWKLVAKCPEEKEMESEDSKLSDYGVSEDCSAVLVDYKPKDGTKMGLMGGAWGGKKCASGWFDFMGSLQKGVMSTSHRMSIDSHNCGVSIFPVREGLKSSAKVHGHAVQALGLTAKHCVSDLVNRGRGLDRDTLFSQDPYAIWVSVGTHHVNSAQHHMTVLGYIASIGGYDAGNDVAVLLLGKFGPKALDAIYDRMIRRPAPSIGRPFAVRKTPDDDVPTVSKAKCEATNRQECEKLKGCRYVRRSGHLWWKKYECISSTVSVTHPMVSTTFEFESGVRGRDASLTVAGWGAAHSKDRPTAHDRAMSRTVAQNLQCVYHVKQSVRTRSGGGDFDLRRPSVNVRAPTGSGINRGDSGGPIVWTGAPNTVVGVLSTGEIGAHSFGNRANYMNLENPSSNALQTLCLAFRDYAWKGNLSPDHREPGGEWLKSRCDREFRPVDRAHPTRMIFTPADAGKRENPIHWNPPRSQRNPHYRFPYSPPAPRDWQITPIPMPKYESYDDYFYDDYYDDSYDSYDSYDDDDGGMWLDVPPRGGSYNPYGTHVPPFGHYPPVPRFRPPHGGGMLHPRY